MRGSKTLSVFTQRLMWRILMTLRFVRPLPFNPSRPFSVSVCSKSYKHLSLLGFLSHCHAALRVVWQQIPHTVTILRCQILLWQTLFLRHLTLSDQRRRWNWAVPAGPRPFLPTCGTIFIEPHLKTRMPQPTFCIVILHKRLKHKADSDDIKHTPIPS